VPFAFVRSSGVVDVASARAERSVDRSLDPRLAEVSLCEQAIVRLAKQRQVLLRIGSAARPWLPMMQLQKAALLTARPIDANERATRAIARH
jgi:hypothetical protein